MHKKPPKNKTVMGLYGKIDYNTSYSKRGGSLGCREKIR